jgi:hypothetical protein
LRRAPDNAPAVELANDLEEVGPARLLDVHPTSYGAMAGLDATCAESVQSAVWMERQTRGNRVLSVETR